LFPLIAKTYDFEFVATHMLKEYNRLEEFIARGDMSALPEVLIFILFQVESCLNLGSRHSSLSQSVHHLGHKVCTVYSK